MAGERRQGGKSPEPCFASMDDTGLWILETDTRKRKSRVGGWGGDQVLEGSTSKTKIFKKKKKKIPNLRPGHKVFN